MCQYSSSQQKIFNSDMWVQSYFEIYPHISSTAQAVSINYKIKYFNFRSAIEKVSD